MHNYLIGFSVYTLAMIGIIFIGFVVVKKCAMAKNGAKSHNNFLEIETSLAIEARKTIHVIRAGNERILIATDTDRTSFLTKLGQNEQQNIVYMGDYGKKRNFEQNEEFSNNFQNNNELKIANGEDLETPKVFKDLMKRLQK